MDRAYQDLKKIFERKSILSGIDNILQWDLSTIMPEKSRENRTKQLSLLSEMKCEIFSNTKIKKLFKNVNREKLNNIDYSNFKEMQKVFLYFSSVPQRLIKKKTEMVAKCEGKWRKAKMSKNFNLVKKELSELTKIVIEESKFLSDVHECSKYDALLKCYEYSYDTKKIEILFEDLQKFINQKYHVIVKNQTGITYNKVQINEKEQFELSKFFMKKLGFDFTRGRLDKSAHPFCGGSVGDIRITTRVNTEDNFSAFEAVMHETGHALYEQNLPKNWCYQPAGRSGGMALHESQSLFIEMQIMKSNAFLHYLTKILNKKFFKKKSKVDFNNLYNLFNKVEKSFIRVEADEVTYPLHIILRFNLEKQIIENNLKIDDLPDIWNSEFKKIFGMEIDNDSNGCLQDIHWYAGLMGYFPTYTLGAIISAQFAHQFRKDIKNLDQLINTGELGIINRWLKKNIHKKASFYSTDEILKNTTGRSLNLNYFKKYLQKKYID
tara:strand:- start:363 stop:1841 length:1479 start_codon:yes stop_codon:yes gene_type:complete